MQITRANLAAAYTGFQTAFNAGLNGVESQWQRVAMRTDSTASEEVYPWLGDLPGMREWLGARQVHALKEHGFTIRNKPYEATVEVDRDHIMDDRLGIFAPLMTELGRSAATHPDLLVFGLLAGGFTTLCYDGQYFFDTDHPVEAPDGTVTTATNMATGSGNPWFLLDTTRVIKPLIYQQRMAPQFVALDKVDDDSVFMRRKYTYGVDGRWAAGYGLWQLAFGSKATLDADGYEVARTAMTGRLKSNGQPAGISPNLLVVGPSNERKGREVLKSQRDAVGADNVWAGTAELYVCPWLV